MPVEQIQDAVLQVFDLRPAAIIRDLDLLRPIYAQTAAYGHFGRELPDFTWERTDRADRPATPPAPDRRPQPAAARASCPARGAAPLTLAERSRLALVGRNRGAPGGAKRPAASERLPVARVCVDVSLAHLDRPFDYLVPAAGRRGRAG